MRQNCQSDINLLKQNPLIKPPPPPTMHICNPYSTEICRFCFCVPIYVPFDFLICGRKALAILITPNWLTSATILYISMMQNSTSPTKLTAALLTRAHRPVILMYTYQIQTKTYIKVNGMGTLLTLKAPSKIAADDTFIFFYFYLLKKIRLDVSCESSARQRIHMKSQALFSSKDKSKRLKCRLLQFLFGALRVN